jgi:hypothetical protein
LLSTVPEKIHSGYLGHGTYIGGFFDSARMFMSMVVLAIIALLLFIKQAATSVGRTVWPASHKDKKWCSACRKYHTLSPVASPYADSEGSFWEEGGRYYFLQGSTKHDVTSIVQDRYWRGHSSDECQFCGARSMDTSHFHSHEGSCMTVFSCTLSRLLITSIANTPLHEDLDKTSGKAKKNPVAYNTGTNNRKATKKKKH